MKKLYIYLLLLTTVSILSAGTMFFNPQEAFKTAYYANDKGLFFDMKLEKDIYLYYEKFKIRILNENNLDITKELNLPIKSYFNNKQIIDKDFKVFISNELLKSKSDKKILKLEFAYQGCLKSLICYAPINEIVTYTIKDEK